MTDKSTQLLKALLLLRTFWALLPQTSYIFPDEFFQSVEVVAGDVFNVTITQTWEFNREFPLRSIVLPQLLFRPMFVLLRTVRHAFPSFELTARILLISQRWIMVCLSFVIDWSVFRISSSQQDLPLKWQAANFLLAVSYVMLTYQIHSFTNSLETVLSVFLLWVLVSDVNQMRKEFETRQNSCCLTNTSAVEEPSVESVHSSGYYLRKRQVKVKLSRSHAAGPGTDIGKHNKELNKDKSSSHSVTGNRNAEHYDSNHSRDSYSSDRSEVGVSSMKTYSLSGPSVVMMAVVNIAGIFNRPTFVAFSIMPFLWWVVSMPNRNVAFRKLSLFLTISVLTILVFITLDTAYYHNISLSDIYSEATDLSLLMDKLVFTPLNFVLYNVNVDNIEQHGRHPFFLHFLVNVPLLFGPVAYFIFMETLQHIFEVPIRICSKSNTSSSSYFSFGSKVPWFIFILTPIVILSVFPHQEPRFLIPLLPIIVIYTVYKMWSSLKLFVSTFVVFNILLSVIYGFLHQGGVLPCIFTISDLSQKEISNESKDQMTFMFSHTYMPPQHYLLGNEPMVKVIDFKGHDLKEVVDNVTQMVSRNCSDGVYNMNCAAQGRYFLSLPGSLMSDLDLYIQDRGKVKVIEKFFPHLSMEDLPGSHCIEDMSSFMNCLSLYLIEFQ